MNKKTVYSIRKWVTVHTCPKSRPAANCNGIQPMGSSPLAKDWMPGKPHSLALSRQQVPEQGVNSNRKWVTVHTCLKIKPAANCNSIHPIGSSPLAKDWMPGKPHSLALYKQQVLEQGVNSNENGNSSDLTVQPLLLKKFINPI